MGDASVRWASALKQDRTRPHKTGSRPAPALAANSQHACARNSPRPSCATGLWTPVRRSPGPLQCPRTASHCQLVSSTSGCRPRHQQRLSVSALQRGCKPSFSVERKPPRAARGAALLSDVELRGSNAPDAARIRFIWLALAVLALAPLEFHLRTASGSSLALGKLMLAAVNSWLPATGTYGVTTMAPSTRAACMRK
jgi:hypothetical protein